LTPTQSRRCSSEHAAGALGDVGRLRVRAAHERGGDRRLVRVEAARVLGEQRLRKRLDADDLAAVRAPS
jgi:hypothetical protein